MLDRRALMLGGIALLAAPAAASAAKRKPFKLNPKYEPQQVRFSGYPRGTIVVDPRNKFLYLIEGRGRARRYGVGVGRAGLAFQGHATINRKAEWPSWTPTQNMALRRG